MAEVLRSDVPSENPEYPQPISEASSSQSQHSFPGSPNHDAPLPGMPTGSNLLPAHTSRSSHRMNRSAANLGRRVGGAVSAVRQVPRSVRGAKSRLTTVSGSIRQSTSAAAMETVDNLMLRAGTIRDTAAQRISDLSETAACRASEMKDVAAARLETLRRGAADELQKALDSARARIYEARSKAKYFQREYPVQTVAALGGAAFIVGVILRTWRSSDD